MPSLYIGIVVAAVSLFVPFCKEIAILQTSSPMFRS